MVRKRDHPVYDVAGRTPTLVVNSYAGSLVIAADIHGAKVVGSYEDAGYGLEVQRLNYPDLDYRETVADWPRKLDLEDKFVIAHPPCAAFSAMNLGREGRCGVGANKFQQTKVVVRYALRQRCLALALESVTGALEGARQVHNELGSKHRYHVFRILQNAVTFGVPQWRPRFWVVFFRRDVLDELKLLHIPVKRTVGELLEPKPSTFPPLLVEKTREQRQLLVDNLDVSDGTARRLLSGAHGYGRLSAIVKRYIEKRYGEVRDQRDLSKQLCVWGNYMASTPYVLDPNGSTPALLHQSFWLVNGRPLSDLEYVRCMGFPDNYGWTARTRKRLREFLSRGVCPPVAAWVLETLEKNVNHPRTFRKRGRSGDDKPHVITLQPGGVADLRPSRKVWDALLSDAQLAGR